MISQSEDVVAVAIASLSRGGREPFTLLPAGERAIRRAFLDAVGEGLGEEAAHALLVFADVLEDDKRSPTAADAIRQSIDGVEDDTEESTQKFERRELEFA